MSCSIPGQNIKAFGRAVHCLARIGDDLFLEPQLDGMALRTVNAARSAFASFLFSPEFFSAFDHKVRKTKNSGEDGGKTAAREEGEGEDAKCRLSMKSAVWVFKSVSSLERTVESADVDVVGDAVRFRLNCRHGVVKTFTVNVLEAETLKVNVDASDSRHKFVSSARVLNEAALNFLANQEEVTMVAKPDVFQLKNFIDVLEEDRKSAVHTVLSMQPGEFEKYSVGVEEGGRPSSPSTAAAGAAPGVEVTYCLKELRAVIGFADAFNLSISASFDSPGSPIVFSLNWPHVCEAALVMATLDEGLDQTKDTQSQKQKRRSHHRHNASQAPSAKLVEEDSEGIRSAETTGRRGNDREHLAHSMPMTGQPRISTQLSESNDGGGGRYSPAMTPIATPGAGDALVDGDDDDDPQVDATVVGGPNGDHRPAGGTPSAPPPSKKARLLFRKCFDATFNPATMVRGADRILAPDSDEEERDADG